MHPILIVGALLAGLPILIHLIMKQEPKRLLFPAIRFLKQTQKTNQRKMRLRHLLLLVLRALLIALFALTLYQPTILSQGFFLSSEQPIAAVFVIDTTPSMGYTATDKSRLDDARGRALALLDDLPAESRVAVIDPADPLAVWEPSIGDARRKIEGMKETRGGGPPVTTGLTAAYQLLRKVDEETGAEAGTLPRLIAVFSDRTAASWDAARNDDLTRLRDGVPPPAVAHLYADVGVDQPVNVALTAAEVRPQVVPRNQPVTITATVQATGSDVPSAVVGCRIDGNTAVERKEVRLVAGVPIPQSFTFRNLKPGFHQAEITLEARDALLFDNVRHVTFRVGVARKILTIVDDPDDAAYWQLAHDKVGEFECDVKTLADLKDFAGYEVVCLMSVADPARPTADGRPLWTLLNDYVTRGGKLLIIPGPKVESSYDPANKPADELMPGKLTAILDMPANGGAVWALDDNALRQRPLLAPFVEWKRKGNVDFLRNPRRAWKYWDVETPPENVVIFYDDDKDPAKRHPAILERTTKAGGKVLLLTTRLDSPWEPDRKWNNYWDTTESSWGVVFPNMLMKYLAGSTEDANFNHTTGQTVILPLPKASGDKPVKLILEGPGVAGPDATPTVGEKQAELRLPPSKTLTAGNYVLRTEDGSWREAFSLTPPADESNLDKLPAATIEALFGPNSIVPAGKELAFRDAIQQRFDQPFDLFPWLLIGVLLLIAVEGLVANRFYKKR